MSDLYGKFERSREAVWAHQQDVEALEKLRERDRAEAQMNENVVRLKAQSS